MLVDQTNYEIPLELESATLRVDVDRDSSIHDESWVFIDFDGPDDEGHTKLTLEEAGKLHDRLGLILGRVSIDRELIHVPHGPRGLNEDLADANYLRSAADRWRTRRLMGFNLTATVAGILDTLADKLERKA
ncbi:hypothetical protein MRBLMI12_000491 [Microbacterium sp. LMI12-1-1.1]|uniref:hypothetical protein n=1 Tax=Microbacterium sp. LMI12-1-1.1 TaxID=3135225 RepID=UPI003435F1FD